VFKGLGEHQKAINFFEKAIKIQPNFAEAHTNLGLLLLLLSNLQKGLDEYEWRKKVPTSREYKLNDIESLEWQGEDLTNKTILILSEQAVGDTIQFARYLYMLQDKYLATIIFRTRKKLIHLFSKSRFKVISDEEPLPKHDFHQFLCSLPKIFYKETKNFPQQINYIPKNTKNILKWRNKLNSIKGLKVGINWQGSATYTGDRLRSIPLNYFERLFTIEKTNFINLQKGFGTEQIKNFKYKDKLYDFSSEVDNGKNAFEDTIGIMQNLDLVISPDTSLSHLSATLGVKTWLLLPYSPDWRWFLELKNSPWYEHVKLYRQEEFNKWDSIFDIVKKDLVNLINEKTISILSAINQAPRN
jgi:tetratricopeptide (TPR) repeat protein